MIYLRTVVLAAGIATICLGADEPEFQGTFRISDKLEYEIYKENGHFRVDAYDLTGMSDDPTRDKNDEKSHTIKSIAGVYDELKLQKIDLKQEEGNTKKLLEYAQADLANIEKAIANAAKKAEGAGRGEIGLDKLKEVYKGSIKKFNAKLAFLKSLKEYEKTLVQNLGSAVEQVLTSPVKATDSPQVINKPQDCPGCGKAYLPPDCPGCEVMRRQHPDSNKRASKPE